MNEAVKQLITQCPANCYPANWLKKNYKSIYDNILEATDFLPANARFNERTYCVINSLTARPKCSCGKDVNNFYADHYGEYCSIDCRNKNTELNESSYFISKGYDYDDVKNKTSFLGEASSLERLYVYVNNFLSIDELPKCKCGSRLNFNFHTKRYNDFCSVQCSFYNEHIQTKSKQTMLNKYGVEHNSKLQSSIDKQQKTLMDRYGVTHNLSIDREQNRQKARETIRLHTYDRLVQRCITHEFTNAIFKKDEYDKSGYDNTYDWKCKLCGDEFKHVYVSGIIPVCPKCFPVNDSSISKAEVEICVFIKSITDEKLETAVRSIITPYELDIYLPNKKIAIEFDGLYWHSNNDKNYHLMKTDRCAELGIRLIHIFEDEWKFKRDIVKSRLKNLLGVESNKIYARKCVIKEVDHKTSSLFLDVNHIQGADKSPIRYGLFYNNELVSLMTFSKNRFNKKMSNAFELVRFCNKLNCVVVGAASKLLSHFEDTHEYETLSTYADLRWSVGGMYEKIGFTSQGRSVPNYWYIKNTSSARESRMIYQKHKLRMMFSNYDNKKTEMENMLDNGFKIIWDCGNLRYMKIKQIK